MCCVNVCFLLNDTWLVDNRILHFRWYPDDPDWTCEAFLGIMLRFTHSSSGGSPAADLAGASICICTCWGYDDKQKCWTVLCYVLLSTSRLKRYPQQVSKVLLLESNMKFVPFFVMNLGSCWLVDSADSGVVCKISTTDSGGIFGAFHAGFPCGAWWWTLSWRSVSHHWFATCRHEFGHLCCRLYRPLFEICDSSAQLLQRIPSASCYKDVSLKIISFDGTCEFSCGLQRYFLMDIVITFLTGAQPQVHWHFQFSVLPCAQLRLSW